MILRRFWLIATVCMFAIEPTLHAANGGNGGQGGHSAGSGGHGGHGGKIAVPVMEELAEMEVMGH